MLVIASILERGLTHMEYNFVGGKNFKEIVKGSQISIGDNCSIS